jgi:hypothetical protein
MFGLVVAPKILVPDNGKEVDRKTIGFTWHSKLIVPQLYTLFDKLMETRV